MIDENKLKEQMFSLVEQIGDERLHIDAVVHLIDDMPTVDAVKKMTRCEPVQARRSPGTGEGGCIYEDEIKTPGNGVERDCTTCRHLWATSIAPCKDCYRNNKWEKKDE